MTQKIKLFALGVISLTLAGCGTAPTLTYDETYKTFIAQETKDLKMINDLTNGITKDDVEVRIGVKNSMINGSINLESAGRTDAKNMKADGDFNMEVMLKEKEQNLDIKGSLEADFIMDKEQLYLKLNEFDAQSNTGPLTTQIAMAKVFAESLTKKRMKIPLEGLDTLSIDEAYALQGQLLTLFEQVLNEYPLFTAGSQTTVHGKNGYFITLNKENILKAIKKMSEDATIKKFLGEEDLTFDIEEEKTVKASLDKLSFSGALVIYDKDTIGLEIFELKGDQTDSAHMKASFGDKKGNIMIVDPVEKFEFMMDRSTSLRGGDALNIKVTTDGKEVAVINGNGGLSISPSALSIDLELEGKITTQELADQGPIQFTFDISSSRKTITSLDIKIPTDAVSVEELMGQSMGGMMPPEGEMGPDAMMMETEKLPATQK